jgi:hypothetical protein
MSWNCNLTTLAKNVFVHFGNVATVVTVVRLEFWVRPAWQQNNERLYLETEFPRERVVG